jgi:hypothetical protein
MSEFLPNEEDRALVTIRSGEGDAKLPLVVRGAIVRYFPSEDASDVAIEYARRSYFEKGAVAVRVMPRPPKREVPKAGEFPKVDEFFTARSALIRIVERMQEARKVEGLEALVETLAEEVGL